jgi:hypothetical protein
VVLCLGAVAASTCLALTAPARTHETLPGLLVLQIFAASSGVLGAARRGYYDALLSRGVGRKASEAFRSASNAASNCNGSNV